MLSQFSEHFETENAQKITITAMQLNIIVHIFFLLREHAFAKSKFSLKYKTNRHLSCNSNAGCSLVSFDNLN